MLADLARFNRHPSALRSVQHVPLAIVPTSVERCAEILRSLPFNETGGGGWNVLLLGIGTWYNLFPLCYFRALDGTWTRNSLTDYDTCPRWLARPSVRAAIRPNHTGAAQPFHFKHFGFGDYAYTRQAAGSTTISEYAADVDAMLVAATAWKEAAPRRRVLWLESTPQHFGGNGSETECGGTPHVHMPPGSESTSPLPPAARALCAAPLRDNATLRDCTRPRTIHDWRNRVAAPLLAARAVSAVPLATALSQRGEQHPGGKDCTHWCHASEASLHMGRATLDVLAKLL